MTTENVYFAGIPVANRTIEYWTDFVIKRSDLPPVIIVTPNVDHFNRLSLDSSFVELYSKSDYILCDSRIIQKLSFLLERPPIKYVVPGSDLTARVFNKLSGSDSGVFIVGSTELEVHKVRKKFNLRQLHSVSPSMGFIKNELEVEQIITAVISSKAQIVFLAVGSPQQEALAIKIKNRCSELGLQSGPVLLCVGASIDFIVGRVKRAPVFIQKAHLEWLYRALSEPKRLVPRYYKNFCWLVKYTFKRLCQRLLRLE
jgi:exopolysaccharide biosynthesis WecB/TagA/CpsF family protein